MKTILRIFVFSYLLFDQCISRQLKLNEIATTLYNENILIRFRNFCYKGNNLFRDNVRIADSPVDIEEMAIHETAINNYPNPAKGKITILGIQINSDIRIAGFLGRIYYAKKTVNEIITINLKGFASGTYFLLTPKAFKKMVVY